MNYKEVDFMIDNSRIVFKKKPAGLIAVVTLLPMLCIGGLSIARDTTALIWFVILSLGMIVLLYRAFSTFTNTKIPLECISKIEIKDAKSDTGEFIFHGTGQLRNYFPAGLNKKIADKLFFIHQKDKRVIIGFAPTNCAATISTLALNGINLIA